MLNPTTPQNYSGLADVEQVWNSYNADHPDRVTVGSLYKLATDQGWTNPRKTSLVNHQTVD